MNRDESNSAESNSATDNEIIHRWHGGQSMRGIARELSIGRERVKRVIRQHQVDREDSSKTPKNSDLPTPKQTQKRSSKLDAYQQQIEQLMAALSQDHGDACLGRIKASRLRRRLPDGIRALQQEHADRATDS